MIKIISLKDIEPLLLIAKKDGLFFNKSTNIYFGYYLNGNLVGFCGLYTTKKTAILKNDFVLKDYRNKGIYKMLNEFRFNYINTLGFKYVEANVTKYSLDFHLKNGAEIVKKYKCCTKIKYYL
jgi:hypothetical protein